MIRLKVYATPGPQGSKSPKGRDKLGRVILVESSKKVRPWREAVKHAALDAIAAASLGGEPWTPMDGPLVLRVTFTLPAPKSLPKKRPSYPTKTPDLSKLVRSTEDALTDSGLWADDARVVITISMKTYPAGIMGAHHDALHAPGAAIDVFPFVGWA